jgi:hypothetical protein
MIEMKRLLRSVSGGSFGWSAVAAIALMGVVGRTALAQQQGPEQAGFDAVQGQEADPPSQVARISLLAGNVSIEPASVDEFTAAEANYPLTTGDRMYADVGATAELQTDALAVRMGQQTDLTVTAMTDTLAQLGLASGSVHLRSYALDPNSTVELDTPNVAVTVLQPGDVRVDVDAQADTTTVTLLSGQVQIDGNGLQQVLEPGQKVRLGGSDPVSAQWMYAGGADVLDRFSSDRDAMYEAALNTNGGSESQYTNPGMIGAEDLSANGDWETDSDNVPVWYPGTVAVDWQPYRCGHWAWVAPWGWTWVECEAWGFAPFHYGRWERRNTVRGWRWGWIPGPPVVRPIYSPALVVFVGGGSGVTAWFPLGPRETYVPWYHTSPLYLNRVNVSNIYSRNTVQVRNVYNQHVTNVYNTTTIVNNVYVNREVATVAVSQASFAAGKPVRQAEVHVDPRALAAAPVLAHPMVTPTRSMVVSAPARAVPARAVRPVLATHELTVERAEPRPNGVQPVIRPGGAVAVPVGPAPIARPGMRPQPEPIAPVARSAPASSSVQEPNPARGAVRAELPAAERPAPSSVQEPNPARGAVRMDTPGPVEAAPARPLFNKAVPPQPRPSFELQQKVMESTEPGKPLSPQQMQTLRPAPAPAPRPAAAPKPAAKPAEAAKPAPKKG